MNRPRLRLAGVVIATVSVLIGTGIVRAAVQRTELEPAAAPTGTTVTMHVETTARFDGTQPGTVYLFLVDVFDSSPSELHCDGLDGAVAVGELTWQTGPVTFGEYAGEGFIGDMTFVVPAIAVGTYYLGENIPARNTGCQRLADFSVTSGSLPNTALPVP